MLNQNAITNVAVNSLLTYKPLQHTLNMMTNTTMTSRKICTSTRRASLMSPNKLKTPSWQNLEPQKCSQQLNSLPLRSTLRLSLTISSSLISIHSWSMNNAKPTAAKVTMNALPSAMNNFKEDLTMKSRTLLLLNTNKSSTAR